MRPSSFLWTATFILGILLLLFSQTALAMDLSVDAPSTIYDGEGATLTIILTHTTPFDGNISLSLQHSSTSPTILTFTNSSFTQVNDVWKATFTQQIVGSAAGQYSIVATAQNSQGQVLVTATKTGNVVTPDHTPPTTTSV